MILNSYLTNFYDVTSLLSIVGRGRETKEIIGQKPFSLLLHSFL